MESERNTQIFKIKYLVVGTYHGKEISLTKEFKHYCVEYIDIYGEPQWLNPCEEDEIAIRELYRNTILHGSKKLGTEKRREAFISELGDLLENWGYDIF